MCRCHRRVSGYSVYRAPHQGMCLGTASEGVGWRALSGNRSTFSAGLRDSLLYGRHYPAACNLGFPMGRSSTSSLMAVNRHVGARGPSQETNADPPHNISPCGLWRGTGAERLHFNVQSSLRHLGYALLMVQNPRIEFQVRK